jgi:DNA-binding SARP family transcriptional activator/tetratricopeptide (TPR) repeat protein
VQFRVLGPVELVTGDGRVISPARRRERCLLAVLLLAPGQVIPAHRLTELLWDGQPAEHARRALYAHVARLRAMLADAGADGCGVALISHGEGYLLQAEPHMVDAHQFRDLVEQAAATPDLDLRAERLRTALALWRGPALHNAATDRLRERLCADLDELRLHAVEEAIATGLALGRNGELVSELAQLTGAHPLRGRLVRLYMLALHHSGRVAEALDVYTATRARLAEELGLDPDPELQRLHRAILRGDPLPISDVTTARPATGIASVVPAQLPLDVAGFTGRERELAILDGLVEVEDQSPPGVTVCVIAGSAGIGKTALAVHWAHRVAYRFPDGQLHLDLRGFDPDGPEMTPAEAVRAFLDAFGVPYDRIPASLAAQVGLYRSLLAGKRVLVVLDNAATADQARSLLPGAPGCLALVTSRNRLPGLIAAQGAQPITLDLLTVAEARDMLTRRLGKPRVAAEPEAVDEIIGLCARLPLALTIAAARAALDPGSSLTAVCARLKEVHGSLDAFTGDDPATDVRAVFTWSYQALNPDGARLFRLLGLHLGPEIAVPAVASLAGVPVKEAESLLAELAMAHLVTEQSPGRYTMHNLLRAYAGEQAHARDSVVERQAALHRLFDHYLHTAAGAKRFLNASGQPIPLAPIQKGAAPVQLTGYGQAIAWFAAENPVLVAAVDQAAASGFDRHAWQLAWALADFFDQRKRWHDLATTHETGLAAAQRLADPIAQAYMHYGLGGAHTELGRFDAAHQQFRQAQDRFEASGDLTGRARASLGLAWMFDRQGRNRDALGHAETALRLYGAAGHRAGQAVALNLAGWCNAQLGEYRHALRCCGRALALHQELGNRRGQAHAWDNLGYAHQHLGEHQEAISCHQQALDLFHQLGDRRSEAGALAFLGDSLNSDGDLDAARDIWQQAVAILDELDDPEADEIRGRLRVSMSQ